MCVHAYPQKTNIHKMYNMYLLSNDLCMCIKRRVSEHIWVPVCLMECVNVCACVCLCVA